MGFLDAFKSPESLEKEGKLKEAAHKYWRKKKYEGAARCYESLGWNDSAAWAWEELQAWDKVAENKEKAAKEDSMYWKDAAEAWEKSEKFADAARCYEQYASEEPWYWENAAESWKKAGDEEKGKAAWLQSANYYAKEAVDDEGIWWEDAAKGFQNAGEKENAVKCMKYYLQYCIDQSKKEKWYYKEIAEVLEKFGQKEKAAEYMKMYEEYEKERKEKALKRLEEEKKKREAQEAGEETETGREAGAPEEEA